VDRHGQQRIEIRSPAVSSMSSSRRRQRADLVGQVISSSVVSPIAETHETTSSPALRAATIAPPPA